MCAVLSWTGIPWSFSPCPLPKQEKSGLYFFLSRKTAKLLLKDTHILTSQRCKYMRDGVWVFNVCVGLGLKKSPPQDAVHETPLLVVDVFAMCWKCLCKLIFLGKTPWDKGVYLLCRVTSCVWQPTLLFGHHWVIHLKGNSSCTAASWIKHVEGVLRGDVARE